MKIIKNFDLRISEINNAIKPYHVFVKDRYRNNMREPNTIFGNSSYKKLDALLPAEYYDFSKCNLIGCCKTQQPIRRNFQQKPKQSFGA